MRYTEFPGAPMIGDKPGQGKAYRVKKVVG
jgi:hypothetical protein